MTPLTTPLRHLAASLTLAILLALAPTHSAAARDLPQSHFAWGAEIGCGIDLTGHDMSDINASAYFGYRGMAVSLVGVGAEVDMVMGNASRCFPIFAILRTSFGHPSPLLFGEMKGGVVINNLDDAPAQADLYLAPSLGIYLATGKSYASYLKAGYVYNGLRHESTGDVPRRIRSLGYFNVGIGITF